MNSTIPQLGITLDHKFTTEDGQIYLNGTQALLRLMIDQRRKDVRSDLNTGGFICGYPGSPVGNVDREAIAQRKTLVANHIIHQQGLNEELAATAVFGTQTIHDIPGAKYDGVFALWFGKAPGVDRAGDAFHHHNFRGVATNGGVLAVAGDDPHARSTIFPSDSNAAFYKFFMPILVPGNIQEILDYGLHGFALSRACGLWTGFKLVTDVADSTASAFVSPERITPVVPQVQLDGALVTPSFRINQAGPPMIESERKIYYGQLEIARSYARLNHLNNIVVRPEAPRFGIVAYGKTYYDLRQALRDLGLGDDVLLAKGISILKLGMIYPLEPRIVEEFSEGLEEILVVEDKRPFIELMLKDILYARQRRPRVVGKFDEEGQILLPAQGELPIDSISKAIARRFGEHLVLPSIAARVGELATVKHTPLALSTSRTPHFCSGCPHNRGLQAPEGAVVGAGVGCHVMALWMGPGYGEVKGYTQMGGEGAQWVGLAPFTTHPHFFQNLGDGTYSHSGSLAIRFAVSANVNVTYKILYNSTVAMIGGLDVQGGKSVANMIRELDAEGVKKIIVTTDDPGRYPGGRVGTAEVWHRDRLIDAEKRLASLQGVTVLLHDQQCATETRRLRKRGKLEPMLLRAHINERVCEGCGDCGRKSNCLSVQPVVTEFGRKTRIHQSSCNQDLSCMLGDCPSFMTVEMSGGGTGTSDFVPTPFPRGIEPPEPVLVVPSREFSICLMGIGGTGVVTVNQILGTAAFMSGMRVQTYDHTGSSQKAGAVVSHLRVLADARGGSVTVPTRGADLYLAFDALVAVSPGNTMLASDQRTIAVVSTSVVPTGEMVANKSKLYPPLQQLKNVIGAVSRKELSVYFDAQDLAERLLGDHLVSNLFLVGVAYQSGALPIPQPAIEAAIRLNGASADMNLRAFKWGRLLISHPDVVHAATRATDAAEVATNEEPQQLLAPNLMAKLESLAGAGDLMRIAARRAEDLLEYQNSTYAERYLERVRRAREKEVDAGHSSAEFSIAVAKNLHKLMAYKDEYEVARLLLDEAESGKLKKAHGGNTKVYWNLQPMALRRLGVKGKVRLGAWFRPVLRLLKSGKLLRGTALDPFSRSDVRRAERELVAHYEYLVEASCARLDKANYDDAVRLASLADMIRGYEDIKIENIRQYQLDAMKLAAQIGIVLSFGPVIRSLLPSDHGHDQDARALSL